MSEKNKVAWLVYPKNSYTNESICKGIFPDGVGTVTAEVNGVELQMIPVAFANLRFLEESRVSSNLEFDMYIQRSPGGPVEPSPFVRGKLKTSLRRK